MPRKYAVDISNFKVLLCENPGMVVVKFGAEWCQPCQKIAPLVEAWFTKMEQYDTIDTVMVDIDESTDLYAFFKSKKMLQGIPAILMYIQGNLSYVFDDAVNTSDPKEVQLFFERCIKFIST